MTPEMDRIYDAFINGILEYGHSDYNRSTTYILHIGLKVDNIPYVFALLNYKDGRSKDEWQIIQLYTERENIPEKYDFFTERKFKHKWGVPYDIYEDYKEQINDLIFDALYDFIAPMNPKLQMDLTIWETNCAIEELDNEQS